MLKFHLFRIKVLQPLEPVLPFEDSDNAPTSAAFINFGINNLETTTVRRGQVWRIGNFNKHDDNQFKFIFGRLRSHDANEYDPKKNEYVQTPHSDADLASVLVDSDLQCAAIATSGTRQLNYNAIARNLAYVMSQQQDVQKRRVRFALDPMFDEKKFLKQIHSANVVTQFEFALTNPNPFSDDIFVKPATEQINKLNAKKCTQELTVTH